MTQYLLHLDTRTNNVKVELAVDPHTPNCECVLCGTRFSDEEYPELDCPGCGTPGECIGDWEHREANERMIDKLSTQQVYDYFTQQAELDPIPDEALAERVEGPRNWDSSPIDTRPRCVVCHNLINRHSYPPACHLHGGI